MRMLHQAGRRPPSSGRCVQLWRCRLGGAAPGWPPERHPRPQQSVHGRPRAAPGLHGAEIAQLLSNELSGGLEPLRRCTALQSLSLFPNHRLTGGLEPLRGCTALPVARVTLQLKGCKSLIALSLGHNHLVASSRKQTRPTSKRNATCSTPDGRPCSLQTAGLTRAQVRAVYDIFASGL